MAHRNRWSRWSKGWFTYSKLLISQFSKIRALQTLRSRTLDPRSPKGSQPPTENPPATACFIRSSNSMAARAACVITEATCSPQWFWMVNGWFMNNPWKKMDGFGLGLWIGHRKIGPCKLKITWKHLQICKSASILQMRQLVHTSNPIASQTISKINHLD